MKKRLLIIPAKGYSKRIKNKNIKIFLGKPIIEYPIKLAKSSNLFSKIHISTDSHKIKNITEKLNCKIDFMRPNFLASKNVPIIDVMRYVTKKYENLGYEFDEIWNISCCTPLLKKSDLVKASKKFKKNKILLSVTKFSAPIEWAFSKKSSGDLKAHFKKKIILNSQKFKTQYHDAGAFVVFSKNNLLNKKFNYLNNFQAFELPRHRAVDIDDIDDWKLAELLYKIKKYG